MRPARSIFLSLPIVLLALAAGFVGPAAAQQPAQEKRIALVVGDGNYEKAPLPTAANDAGLIAQTLQAAGFDVIGARDIDADALRNSLRDFMQKAQADPANTVAMIYLSGYVVQLAGENYYIPVDAKISRDTDIPIEGLRISDYTRQLASIPLKASIVVLDSAGPQPFIDGGNPIAGGLALVDASPNMLIAFNAAPGTVAPPETGNYGVYAQALAEMIRTGGLSLPDVFDRVRLRVSENSKGAQVPWDDQKIQARFSFFDRAPDAPPVQGSPDQVAAIRNRPIRDLGAQEAFTAALTRDTFQAYEDFLAAYPRDPLAKRVRAILAARREAITWRRTYLADTPDAYWSYLRRYPQGPHAWDARRRLSYLSAALEPPPSFPMMDYDLPPPPPDEFVYVDRPVFYFGDPEFAFEPPPPPPVFFLGPPPDDFVVLAPPIVAVGIGVGVGLFILPRPAFVPLPVYCAPPVYVAPPANNIIFNNIHNTTVINTVINNPSPSPAAVAAAGGPKVGTAGTVGTVGPALPTHVEQRATLIQQGKMPAPPSASINPRASGVTPGTTPANLPQGGGTQVQPGGTQLRKELPKANALPGATGAPPLPPGGPGAVTPNSKLTTPTQPGQTQPGQVNPQNQHLAPGAPGTAPNKLTTPTQPGQPNLREEKVAPGGPGRPPVVQNQTTPTAPTTSPNLRERDRRGAPPSGVTTTAPSRSTPPPPPKPEMRRAPPPPPPKPEMRRAPPPPPPPRAAPPPPPRVASPPPPRAAPPPPPRPAPPPPRPAPAPAKKCPPNQPKC